MMKAIFRPAIFRDFSLMGFIRLIVIIAGIALVYLVLKRYVRSLQKPPQTGPVQQPGQGEDMVRCAVCGVNTPRSEAIFSGGNYFCCDEHRQAHRK
jgi:uncharacterized protein